MVIAPMIVRLLQLIGHPEKHLLAHASSVAGNVGRQVQNKIGLAKENVIIREIHFIVRPNTERACISLPMKWTAAELRPYIIDDPFTIINEGGIEIFIAGLFPRRPALD